MPSQPVIAIAELRGEDQEQVEGWRRRDEVGDLDSLVGTVRVVELCRAIRGPMREPRCFLIDKCGRGMRRRHPSRSLGTGGCLVAGGHPQGPDWDL